MVKLQHLLSPSLIVTASFFSGQSWHTSSSLIVLYLWLGARRPMAPSPTVLNITSHLILTLWISSMLAANATFKKLWGHFLTMQGRSITNYSLLSAPLLPAKPRPPSPQNKRWSSSSNVATYLNDDIVYQASNMMLCGHADAGFLNKTNSHSRAGAHIYLSEDDPFPQFNGAILSIAQIIV